jgi:hypothetical protein
MKRICLLAILTFASPALADSNFMTPGLWESKSGKMVVDGRDMTASINAVQERMQAALANMPPEQRKRVEDSMKQTATARFCISPEMASGHTMPTDPQSHCDPVDVKRNGNHASYKVHCKTPEGVMDGVSEAVSYGDRVVTSMDTTRDGPTGTHKIHIESEMTLVSTDCQGVPPLDQAVKAMKARQ